MKRTAAPIRLGSLLILGGLVSLFALDSVQGQGIRGGSGMPPRPPTGGATGITGGSRPPFGGGAVGGSAIGGGAVGGNGIRGGIGGGAIGSGYTFSCSKCGKDVGSGRTRMDAPASCPFCGVRFINGGLGTGGPPINQGAGGGIPPNPGGLIGTPPANAGMLGGMPNPGLPAQPGQLGGNIGALPPTNQGPPAGAPENPGPVAQNNDNAQQQPPLQQPPLSQPQQQSSSGTGWVIAAILGFMVVVFLGLSGVLLFITLNKSAAAPPPRSRPRSRRRDEDD